jgi:signal transduction histidine kinase
MSEVNRTDVESRVLVLAPTGKDGANSRAVLGKAGIACAVCRDVSELCREIGAGIGAVLLTEEALSLDKASRLADALRGQPPWSDLPVVALSRGGPDSSAALRAMETLGNVILLERPVRVSTLLTAVRTALRARARQYQARAHLAQLQEADRRKDEFLAMLAHELRNPLAPLRNALHIVRQRGPDRRAATRHAWDLMDRQVGHLVRLVDDLLDVARITRGKVELRREAVDLAEAATRAVESARPLIDARRHRLTYEGPPVPVRVEADPVRLTQVIGNLLNNAAKYTDEGGQITLMVEREGREAVVRVRDTGVGITPEMLPKVFDLFTQVDRTLDRAQGGLGIGLTLVRSLVEMHGGCVQAFSAGVGAGSEFVVRLPVLAGAEGNETGTAPGAAAPVTPRRILVVDDNVDSAESLALLLQMAGHQSRTAHNGPGAIAATDAFRPEVVLLDIGLPGMDGYEVAQRLREAAGGEKLLLIAQTGYGQEEDRRRSRKAGFDAHLVKPVDPGALQTLLVEFGA